MTPPVLFQLLPCLLVIFGLLDCRCLSAQVDTAQPHETRTLKARSRSLTIIDGDDRLVGQIVPELDVDTYVYHPSAKAKTISFITDVEQLDFRVEPGEVVDFLIELEEPSQKKQLCPQRLSPVDPQGVRYRGSEKNAASGGDVIAFTLGPNHAIHFQGSINGSEPLDLIFDTGASVGVLSEQGRAKGASLAEGKSNRYSFAGIEIENVPVVFIDYRGSLKADGVVGYNCFMGKVVKIDYTAKQMAVMDALPNVDGYQKIDLSWQGAGTFVPITLRSDGREYETRALFDTGSKWSLSLCMNEPFVQRNIDQIPSVGTRYGRMTSGQRIKNKVVVLEKLRVGGLAMNDVQADLEVASRQAGLAFNILGNDLLRRFDVVIDYQKSEIYLKPNGLRDEPYNAVPMSEWVYWCGGALVIALASLVAASRWRRRFRST